MFADDTFRTEFCSICVLTAVLHNQLQWDSSQGFDTAGLVDVPDGDFSSKLSFSSENRVGPMMIFSGISFDRSLAPPANDTPTAIINNAVETRTNFVLFIESSSSDFDLNCK